MKPRLLTPEQLDWLEDNITQPISYLAEQLQLTEKQVWSQISNRIGNKRQSKVYKVKDKHYGKGGKIIAPKWDFSGENV